MKVSVLAGAAWVALVSVGYAASANVTPPPARFDRPHPNLVLLETPLRDVRRLCGALFGRSNFVHFSRVDGCAAVGDGQKPCIVIVPLQGAISAAEREALIRHERAHCNGWSGSHPLF